MWALILNNQYLLTELLLLRTFRLFIYIELRSGTTPDQMWTDLRSKYCFACGTGLRNRCISCNEPIMSLKFKFCPYCGANYKLSAN